MAKILVVDDSSLMRKLAKDVLKKLGYKNICEASNGEEAVEMAEKEKPKIILLDIIMPGWPTKKVVEELGKAGSYKIIYVTSVEMSEKEKKGLMKNKGVVGFISKPINKEKLGSLLKKNL